MDTILKKEITITKVVICNKFDSRISALPPHVGYSAAKNGADYVVELSDKRVYWLEDRGYPQGRIVHVIPPRRAMTEPSVIPALPEHVRSEFNRRLNETGEYLA